MGRSLPWIVLFLALQVAAFAQVQTVGDVSFAIPAGWTYTAGRDVGAMAQKEGDRFWLIAVYTSTPCSGDPNADFKAAWKRTVLTLPDYKNVNAYDPYKLDNTVGYPGKYTDDSSVNHQSYTRLYMLQAKKSCVPVMFTSANRGVLDGMEHWARAVVGSVRVAPLRASPIKNTITVADLAGFWAGGLMTNINYYNSSGQYQGNSLTAVNFGYTIAVNGSYTYKFGGLMNNRATNDDDSGVVELGGEFLTFKGRKHTNRYRFVNLQQALDGSTVLTLFPDAEMSKIDSYRDSQYYTRPPKK
jgi:hypothetical protein